MCMQDKIWDAVNRQAKKKNLCSVPFGFYYFNNKRLRNVHDLSDQSVTLYLSVLPFIFYSLTDSPPAVSHAHTHISNINQVFAHGQSALQVR